MRVSEYTSEGVAALHKALSDPTRVRILLLLLELDELCGCDIETALGITQSKASRHLIALKQVGLVEDRREGTWVYYRAPAAPDPLVAAMRKAARAALRGDPTVQRDLARTRSLRRSPCAEPEPKARKPRSTKR